MTASSEQKAGSSKTNGAKGTKRRIFVFICLLPAIFLPAVSRAQQPTKVPRVGFLDASTASGSAGLLEAFWQEMRKLGWIEGKNITMEYRFAEGKTERGRQPDLAADLVRLKVDLIIVAGDRRR
jgi:putative ABC transport system substrate-binding protein